MELCRLHGVVAFYRLTRLIAREEFVYCEGSLPCLQVYHVTLLRNRLKSNTNVDSIINNNIHM